MSDLEASQQAAPPASAGELRSLMAAGYPVKRILQVIEDRIARGEMPGHNFPAEWWPAVAAAMRAGLATISATPRKGPSDAGSSYPTRSDAARAGRAFFAEGNGTLGVEGADFHVMQRDGERWHFEAGRDPASN